MPRKPRIEYEGAFYHVITRGNQKQKIFKSPTDYQKYIRQLSYYKTRYHCAIYAFVLMSNHVHILIETKEAPLSKVFQGINQSYTVYFNKKYDTVGHLFQGRYKAMLCDRESYLLSLLKYIHFNPVRARMVEKISDYPWSSHVAYTGKNDHMGIVEIDHVLRMFSENKGRARRLYHAFMEETGGLKKDDVYAVIDQRVQGSNEFAEEVFKRIEETPVKRWKKDYTLERIAAGVTAFNGTSRDELRSPARGRALSTARCLFSLTAKLHGYKGVEIAAYLEKEPASLAEYDKKKGYLSEDVKKLLVWLKKNQKT